MTRTPIQCQGHLAKINICIVSLYTKLLKAGGLFSTESNSSFEPKRYLQKYKTNLDFSSQTDKKYLGSSSPRLARMLLQILNFDLDVAYQPVRISNTFI